MKTTNYASWTLRRYFDEVYFPSKAANGRMALSTTHWYRNVISKLERLTGRNVRLSEFNPAFMEKFSAQLVEAGYQRHSVRNVVTTIKSIIRHWKPEVFPSEMGGAQGPLSFIDADIEGTLEQIFTDHYLTEKTSISSENTIRQYGRCLRLFSMFLGQSAEPCHLTDRVVGKFLRWLVEVGEVKAVTANGYVKQLLAMWTWLAKKRIVECFPTVEKLKEPQPMPVSWTEDELHKLMKACHDQVGYIGPMLANQFWVAFHMVCFDTGERTGAMIELRWNWFDWKTGYLSVPGEFRKGGVQSAVYKLKPATVKSLREIEFPRRDLIFDIGGKDITTFYLWYRKLIKSSGLPWEVRKCGPQKVRRTFASYIEAAGGNATKALKHRDRRVTEDSYLDPRIVEVESENAKLFSLDAAGGAA